ncbi:9086_t:CDS:2 [Ambispora leptoticha]|uniref:9086_t:CDS:1 n=1 Tax=Ambispora leptoticha TaxID=144679 RepID=A0A9N8Z9H5_9GLOM|nr:9086_t:CDS:2 [Ambispora leptoticha]
MYKSFMFAVVRLLLDSEFFPEIVPNMMKIKRFVDWIPSIDALQTAIKEGKGSKDTFA